MNDPSDTDAMDKLIQGLRRAMPGVPVVQGAGSFTLDENIYRIINSVFYSVISITMFLCFFSLCASMATNLYE